MECALCHSMDIYQVYQVKDFFLSAEEFGIWECQTCGVRFTLPVPSEESMPLYYKSEEYLSHFHKKRTLFSLLYGFVRSINVKQKANFVERHFLRTGSLLDVGCGAGTFLNEMNKRGWNCQGVEPDENSRRFINETYKLPVVNMLSSMDVNSRFDVITLWHVLEHFYNPRLILNSLNFHLNENGVLILAVPNFESLDARYYGSYWAAYDVPRHLFHFNYSALKKILESTGFKVVNKGVLAIDVFYISYLSEKYLNKKLSFFTGIFKALLFYIHSSKISDYSSIVVVAKKVKDTHE